MGGGVVERVGVAVEGVGVLVVDEWVGCGESSEGGVVFAGADVGESGCLVCYAADESAVAGDVWCWCAALFAEWFGAFLDEAVVLGADEGGSGVVVVVDVPGDFVAVADGDCFVVVCVVAVGSCWVFGFVVVDGDLLAVGEVQCGGCCGFVTGDEELTVAGVGVAAVLAGLFGDFGESAEWVVGEGWSVWSPRVRRVVRPEVS